MAGRHFGAEGVEVSFPQFKSVRVSDGLTRTDCYVLRCHAAHDSMQWYRIGRSEIVLSGVVSFREPMRHRLTALAIFLAIPVLGFCVLSWVRSQEESAWRIALKTSTPQVTDAQLRQNTLANVCADPKLKDEPPSICGAYKRVGMVRLLMGGALALSILYPMAVFVAGRQCRNDRILLLQVFLPGLRITNAVVIVLVIVNAIGLIATIWYGESELIGQVHLKMLLLIVLAAIGGVYSIIRGTAGLVSEASTFVVAKLATREESPRLWDFVRRLSDEIGTEPPENVLVGLEPNFFVTQSRVVCPDRTLGGRTMYISAPLCRILSIQQLRAVIAHELGHFKGADTDFSLRFYPIYRGAVASIEAVVGAGSQTGEGSLALLPAIHAYSFFLQSFAEAENGISRTRELAADTVAAEIAGRLTFAAALVRIVGFSAAWDRLSELMSDCFLTTVKVAGVERKPDQFFANLSSAFLQLAVESAKSPAVSSALDARTVPHPTDSHPPLSVRLAALGTTVGDLVPDGLSVNVENPASSLIGGLEPLEIELSSMFHRARREHALQQIEVSKAEWADNRSL